jgi:hypothetical protein
LTAAVLSTSGGPTSPALLVVDPPEDATTAARSEIILFDGTFSGTSFVTSNLANRYLQGSAAASGIVHPIGAKVISAPLGTQLEDLWDEIESHDSGSSAHGATSSPTADTIMARDSNSRSQVASPAVSNDAANKGYVDSHANLTGPHSATSSATASRLVVRDGSGRAQFASPSASADAATKGYVDGFLPETKVFYDDTQINAGSADTFFSGSPGVLGTFVAPTTGRVVIGSSCYVSKGAISSAATFISTWRLGTSAGGSQVQAETLFQRSGRYQVFTTTPTWTGGTITLETATGLTPGATYHVEWRGQQLSGAGGLLQVRGRKIVVMPAG